MSKFKELIDFHIHHNIKLWRYYFLLPPKRTSQKNLYNMKNKFVGTSDLNTRKYVDVETDYFYTQDLELWCFLEKWLIYKVYNLKKPSKKYKTPFYGIDYSFPGYHVVTPKFDLIK